MPKKNKPTKFSVITPSFNQGEYIEQTIRSVIAQDYPSFEHIVIDGGSTDQTISILRKYPHLTWISEEDSGQSDALNKGFRMVTGDIIAWINSDDWYEPIAFKIVEEFFAVNCDKNVVMGDCNLVDSIGKVFGKVVNSERGFDEIKKYWVGESIPTQPAIFFRKKLLDEFGFLDESLHFAMDFDLWMRFAQKNRFFHLNRVVANYRFHHAAKGGDQDWTKFKYEWKMVYKRYAAPNIESPKITVLMPVYNGERYLREAIDSVLNQTFTDFELLIVNDSSTDGSLEIAKTYDDPRIRLIENEYNLGVVATRNKGLASSRGEYIAMLDCDDVAFPSRLAEQAAFLDTHPEFSMIGSWVEIINESGRSTGDVWKLNAPAEKVPSILLFHNYFAQSSVFIRKRSLPEVCYRPGFPGTEDYDLWVRMAAVSKVWNIPRVLVKYRVHSASLSFVKAKHIEHCVQEIIKYQLNNLGIEPTPNEIQIHRNLGTLEFRSSKEFIGEVALWLSKLLDANNRKKCYCPECFGKVIAERWLTACFAATGLGLWTFKKYRDSPLSSGMMANWWLKISLALKCVIRWEGYHG